MPNLRIVTIVVENKKGEHLIIKKLIAFPINGIESDTPVLGRQQILDDLKNLKGVLNSSSSQRPIDFEKFKSEDRK